MDKHNITIFTTYISVDLARHEIFHAKVGKCGINIYFDAQKDRLIEWVLLSTNNLCLGNEK